MHNILKKLNETLEVVVNKQQELASKEMRLNNQEARLIEAQKEFDKERQKLVALREQIDPYLSLNDLKKEAAELHTKTVKAAEQLRVDREKFDGEVREQRLIIQGERMFNEQEAKRLNDREKRLELDIKARVKAALENVNRMLK